eukprot:GILJ01014654.1.p1 GENE.GILJ01014654.1~~GILJ01014654.1.p1  ORF type:complete len:839 (-),score=125.09 GILJ01014654.1:35-2515(-)
MALWCARSCVRVLSQCSLRPFPLLGSSLKYPFTRAVSGRSTQFKQFTRGLSSQMSPSREDLENEAILAAAPRPISERIKDTLMPRHLFQVCKEIGYKMDDWHRVMAIQQFFTFAQTSPSRIPRIAQSAEYNELLNKLDQNFLSKLSTEDLLALLRAILKFNVVPAGFLPRVATLFQERMHLDQGDTFEHFVSLLARARYTDIGFWKQVEQRLVKRCRSASLTQLKFLFVACEDQKLLHKPIILKALSDSAMAKLPDADITDVIALLHRIPLTSPSSLLNALVARVHKDLEQIQTSSLCKALPALVKVQSDNDAAFHTAIINRCMDTFDTFSTHDIRMLASHAGDLKLQNPAEILKQISEKVKEKFHKEEQKQQQYIQQQQMPRENEEAIDEPTLESSQESVTDNKKPSSLVAGEKLLKLMALDDSSDAVSLMDDNRVIDFGIAYTLLLSLNRHRCKDPELARIAVQLMEQSHEPRYFNLEMSSRFALALAFSGVKDKTVYDYLANIIDSELGSATLKQLFRLVSICLESRYSNKRWMDTLTQFLNRHFYALDHSKLALSIQYLGRIDYPADSYIQRAIPVIISNHKSDNKISWFILDQLTSAYRFYLKPDTTVIRFMNQVLEDEKAHLENPVRMSDLNLRTIVRMIWVLLRVDSLDEPNGAFWLPALMKRIKKFESLDVARPLVDVLHCGGKYLDPTDFSTVSQWIDEHRQALSKPLSDSVHKFAQDLSAKLSQLQVAHSLDYFDPKTGYQIPIRLSGLPESAILVHSTNFLSPRTHALSALTVMQRKALSHAGWVVYDIKMDEWVSKHPNGLTSVAELSKLRAQD